MCVKFAHIEVDTLLYNSPFRRKTLALRDLARGVLQMPFCFCVVCA